jgi:hypothetical protein
MVSIHVLGDAAPPSLVQGELTVQEPERWRK